MAEPMSAHEQHDYYEILQVHPKASLAVIKKAYRTLLLELGNHPDTGGSAESASLITEAYHVLSDPERRANYDRQYFARTASGTPAGAAPKGAAAPTAEPPSTAGSSLIVLCPRCRTKNRVRSQELLAVAKCSRCAQALSRLPDPVAELREQVLGRLQAAGAWLARVTGVGFKLPRPLPRIFSLGVPLLLLAVSLYAGGHAFADMFAGLADPVATADKLKKEGKLDQAASQLVRAVDRDPANPRLYELLGDVYAKQNDPIQALAQYQNAVKLNPSNPYYWDLEGNIYDQLQRPKEAESCYRQALKLDPQYAQALVALGNLEAKRNHFDEAERLYQQALRTAPSADVHYNIGLVHQWSGKTDQAIKDFKQALVVDPNNRSSMVNLAALYYERHQYDLAAAQLLRASQLKHADLDLHLRLAEIYEHAGRTQEAIKEWHVCLEQGKGKPDVLDKVKKALIRHNIVPAT